MSAISYLKNMAEGGRQREEQIENLNRLWSRFSSNYLSVVGTLMILFVCALAVFAPYIAPYPGDASGTVKFDQKFEPPSAEHPFGTDSSGRDVLSRIIFGARVSLMTGVIVLSLAISFGVTVGLIAGYVGGWPNLVIMRVTDVFLSVPAILLAMAVTAILGPNLTNALIAIAFHWWTWYARIVQGEVLSIKEEEYVEASQSLGASWFRTAKNEVLPNVLTPVTVKATLDMGFVILVGAGLGFLGLGAQPPTPEWGVMVAQGRDSLLSAWWVSTFPGLMISFTVIGFNLLGDGLRDMLDVDLGEGGEMG